MKRLNPKTGIPFKLGEAGEDGRIFIKYGERVGKKNGFFDEFWTSDPELLAMQVRLGGYKYTAKKQNVPFDLDIEYLQQIKTDVCPVFKTIFVWHRIGLGQMNDESPTLDRVMPLLGYIRGNVVWISAKANRIKQNVTEKELYAVADWLHDKRKEVLNAFKIEPPSISAGSHISGAVGNELGSVSTPWTWEDSDDAHHHCGADAGKDTDHSTKESS